MIENEDPVIADSLWTATANRVPRCPPLDGDARADVAVVGGGFTGLSAALHLAERGIDVRLLEAEAPGWGASGRNGGQVNPGLKEDPDAILARFGADAGQRMIALGDGSADLVFALIERHGIDCDARRPGWIQAAHNQAALPVLDARVDQWQRLGAPLERLDRAGIAALTGTDAYAGGLIDRRGGNLHPLNYALGLADAAQKAGAVLHGQSRVTALEPSGDGWRLRTGQGSLGADRVLICTNGYSGGLAPPLPREVVPVRSVQVATAPLSDNLRRSILPGLQAVSDSRRLLLYFRMTVDGRFVMGGRGTYDRAGTRRQLASLRAVSARLFPQLDGAEWQHGWGGLVAVTADHYPHLVRLGPGAMAALGYNGRGVAMATAVGKALAGWAAEGDEGGDESGLPLPVTAPRPIPLHGLRRAGVGAAVAWNRMLDRLGR